LSTKLKAQPFSDEKGFSHGIIFLIEEWIFHEHLLKYSFVLDWEFTLRGFVVASLVKDGIYQIEENLIVWMDNL
jgi:hypothetical protein